MEKWTSFGTLLALSFALCCVQCQSDDDPKTAKDLIRENEIHARQIWIQADKDLKAMVSKIIRKAMPVVMKEVYKKELSSPCMSSLLQFVTALKQSKEWAYKMLDSMGRLPEGLLSGTYSSLGNYDECVGIHVNETKVKLQGQYCTIIIHPPIPAWKPFTSMHGTVPELFNISAPDSVITLLATIAHNLHVVNVNIGICTPSMCSKDDINKLVQIIPEKLGLNWGFDVKNCEVQEPIHFTHSQLVVLYVMGAVVLVLLFGTVIDVKYTSDEMEKKSVKSTIFQIAKSFSILSNVKKLSDWTCPQDKLAFVYGLTFIVYYWVVISDTFMYVNYDTTSNIMEAFKILKWMFYEIALNRVLPLQILFFISGLITTYRWLKCPDQGLNIFKFYLKKYWRYTPAYALVLALLIVSPTWGSGPTWKSQMNPMYRNCRDNWWYNILYINNFMDSSDVCLDHTWVFAVYAQLHVISVVILIPLKLRPKIGLSINFVLAVTSLASVALTNVYYDLAPNEVLAFLHTKDRMFYSEHSYYRVYTHLTMYCCGIFVAYLVHEYPNLKISKKMRCFLWILTFAGLAASFAVVHVWRSGEVPSPLIAAIYTSFSKVAESAFMAWLSVACMTGYGGYLKDFLSWRPFHFLARITFIAYLMHVPIQSMVNSFRKSKFYLNELELFYVTLNTAVATLIIAYILFVAFEAPFLSLTEALTKKYRRRTNSNQMVSAPMTEKPVKFSDVANNSRASSPEPKVWLNVIEKSRC